MSVRTRTRGAGPGAAAVLLLAWTLLGGGRAAAEPASAPGALAAPAVVPASGAAPTTGPASSATPAASWGLALDLGWASTYVFRGANVFGDSRGSQYGMVNPGVTWSIGKTGLSVGYWGAYQVNGGNVRGNLDRGVGAEQDLIVAYTRELRPRLSVTGGLTAYFNLGADRAVAGTGVPSYLEPLVGVAYSRGVELGLKVSYYAAVQQALELDRYLYVNPTVARSFALREEVQLSLAAGFGYKLYNDRGANPDNVYDVLLTVGLPVAIRERFYVKPSVSAAWTNIPGKGLANEWVFFGGVNLGANL